MSEEMPKKDNRSAVLDAFRRSLEGEVAFRAAIQEAHGDAFSKSSTGSRSYHSKSGNPFSKSKFHDTTDFLSESEQVAFAERFLQELSKGA